MAIDSHALALYTVASGATDTMSSTEQAIVEGQRLQLRGAAGGGGSARAEPWVAAGALTLCLGDTSSVHLLNDIAAGADPYHLLTAHIIGLTLYESGGYDRANSYFYPSWWRTGSLHCLQKASASCLQNKDFRQAKTYAELALKHHRTDYRAYEIAGDVILSAVRAQRDVMEDSAVKACVSKAVTCYSRALRLAPNSVHSVLGLATAHVTREQPDEALKLLAVYREKGLYGVMEPGAAAREALDRIVQDAATADAETMADREAACGAAVRPSLARGRYTHT